jgi:hypothetical protein
MRKLVVSRLPVSKEYNVLPPAGNSQVYRLQSLCKKKGNDEITTQKKMFRTLSVKVRGVKTCLIKGTETTVIP